MRPLQNPLELLFVAFSSDKPLLSILSATFSISRKFSYDKVTSKSFTNFYFLVKQVPYYTFSVTKSFLKISYYRVSDFQRTSLPLPGFAVPGRSVGNGDGGEVGIRHSASMSSGTTAAVWLARKVVLMIRDCRWNRA